MGHFIYISYFSQELVCNSFVLRSQLALNNFDTILGPRSVLATTQQPSTNSSVPDSTSIEVSAQRKWIPSGKTQVCVCVFMCVLWVCVCVCVVCVCVSPIKRCRPVVKDLEFN